MKPTNVWNPASKILNFDEIEKSLDHRRILYSFSFQDEYRSITIPLDKSNSLGEITILEYYKEYEGFYFIFWGKDRKYFSRGSFIYMVDARSGKTVEEGRGLSYFERFLKDDRNLLDAGCYDLEKTPELRIRIKKSFEMLLLAVDSEVKKTLRSNAEAFIESITT